MEWPYHQDIFCQSLTIRECPLLYEIQQYKSASCIDTGWANWSTQGVFTFSLNSSLVSNVTLNYIGSDMSCENTNSVYTYKSQSYCNGWSGISLEKCIAKCTMNDVPSLCRRQQVECAYVIYHHLNKWCHLGDAICRPKPHRIVRNYIYTKEGEN